MAALLPQLLTRLALLIVAVVVGSQSVAAVLVQLASADHRLLADQLENGRQPGWAYLEEFDRERKIDAFAWTCQRDLVRGMITLRLSALDAAMASGDLQSIDSSRDAAVRDIEASRDCDPLDGNAWLRLALIERRFLGPTDRMLGLLAASQWSAPSEGWVLRQRVGVLTHLVAAGVAAAEPMLRSDVRRLALGASHRDLEVVERMASGRAAGVIADELTLLPDFTTSR